MDYIIRIIKSVETSSLLIDGTSKTVKHEVEKQEHGLLPAMASSLIQAVASSLINGMTGKGVMRAGKGQKNGILSLLALLLIMKVLGKGIMRAQKGVRRAGKDVLIWIIRMKIFNSIPFYPHSIQQYQHY